jgi:hypothetical protein
MSTHDDEVTLVQVAFDQEIVELTSVILFDVSIFTIEPGSVLVISIPSMIT